MTQPLKAISDSIKHWYLVTIIGAIFIMLGIWVFSTPLESYLVLATLFSISFLTAGIAEIAFALGNKNRLDHWGWYLASGLFSALIGIFLLSNPGLSMVTLPLYVGFGVLFRSIAGISFALTLKDTGTEYQSLLWLSIGGVILAFLLIWNPAVTGMTLVTLTALIFILLGVTAVLFSLKLKDIHKKLKSIRDSLDD
ncbi:HdeD family acid-resistance protein [Algoriphagus namhaensis]